MSKAKCSSENPMTCRYHGHDAQVAFVKEQKQKAEASKDFEGYFTATKTLEALEKRQQVIAGLDKSLKEAVVSGDFSRYMALTENFKEATGHDYEKEVADKPAPEVEENSNAVVGLTLDDREDTKGYVYVSANDLAVLNGTYAPDRIHSINEYGEEIAYVNADSYTHHDYPDDMRIQANRPLTDDEVQKVAQLTGYQYRSTLGGEGMSDPDRCGNASILIGSDMTKAAGRKSHLSDFEDGLEYTLRYGSPIRKTNRSGPGTAGTRLVDGLVKHNEDGKPLENLNFTLYYQDSSVKFKK